MVILPKRVSLLVDQLFRILWSLSIFLQKADKYGSIYLPKSKNILSMHTPYLWPMIVVSRKEGTFLNLYRSQFIGLQFFRN